MLRLSCSPSCAVCWRGATLLPVMKIKLPMMSIIPTLLRKGDSRLERSASDISDVRRYLLDDFSFRSRCHVLRVFKLCCLVVGEPHREYPSFSVILSGCGMRRTCVQLCLRIKQTHILSADYCHQSFFREHPLALYRSTISTAGAFFIGTDSTYGQI